MEDFRHRCRSNRARKGTIGLDNALKNILKDQRSYKIPTFKLIHRAGDISMNRTNNSHVTSKRDWTRPGFQRLEAGAAESQRGNTPDGGGGQQGS